MVRFVLGILFLFNCSTVLSADCSVLNEVKKLINFGQKTHNNLQIAHNLILKPSEQKARFPDLEYYNRVFVSNNRYPWSTIGRYNSPNAGCTATLVSPCHILTARHCVKPEVGAFIPLAGQLNKGVPNKAFSGKMATSEEKIFIVKASKNSIQKEFPFDAPNEWAIIQLEGRPGDKFGYMGVAKSTPPDIFKRHQFRLAGYGFGISTEVPSANENVRGLKIEDTHKIFYTDEKTPSFIRTWKAQVSEGDSGSPLWTVIDGKPIIYGITSAILTVNSITTRKGIAFTMAERAVPSLESMKKSCPPKK